MLYFTSFLSFGNVLRMEVIEHCISVKNISIIFSTIPIIYKNSMSQKGERECFVLDSNEYGWKKLKLIIIEIGNCIYEYAIWSDQ